MNIFAPQYLIPLPSSPPVAPLGLSLAGVPEVMVAGRSYTVWCETWGAHPPAALQLYLGGSPLTPAHAVSERYITHKIYPLIH